MAGPACNREVHPGRGSSAKARAGHHLRAPERRMDGLAPWRSPRRASGVGIPYSGLGSIPGVRHHQRGGQKCRAVRTRALELSRCRPTNQRRSGVESRHAATWPRVYGATRRTWERRVECGFRHNIRATGTLNRDVVGDKKRPGAPCHSTRQQSPQAGAATGLRHPITRRFGIAEPVIVSTARARVVSLNGSSPSQLAAIGISGRVFPVIEGSARFFLLGAPKHRSQAGLGPQIDRSHSILPDAPARCRNGSRDAPRLIRGGAGLRAHQKGEQALFHGAFSFALRGPVQQPVHPWSFSKGASLENHPLQGELPLLCRIDAPAVVPAPYLVNVLSYRDAVRLCWVLRRVRNMSLIWLAAEAGLTRQHVGDYLNRDDRSSRRNLPAEKVAAFERVCGNTAISQWLAAQSHLTVLEEMQASRRAA